MILPIMSIDETVIARLRENFIEGLCSKVVVAKNELVGDECGCYKQTVPGMPEVVLHLEDD